jgi:2'-5' RNA ligase
LSEEKKIRLFTALGISSQLKGQLAALPQEKLDFKKIAHPEDFHITLRFLGEIDQAVLPSIESTLEDMKKPAVFGVEVAGLGIFERDRQTVLYAAVQSVRKVALLSDAIMQRLEKIGLSLPKGKDYVPHVTVASLNSSRNFAAYQKAHEKRIQSQWQAASFHLIQSADAMEGQKRYSVLRTYDLSPY